MIRGQHGSAVIWLNDAVAHKARVDDLMIIFQYRYVDVQELEQHHPTRVYVDGSNRIAQKKPSPESGQSGCGPL